MKQDKAVQTNVLNGGGTLLTNSNEVFLVLKYLKTHIKVCVFCMSDNR